MVVGDVKHPETKTPPPANRGGVRNHGLVFSLSDQEDDLDKFTVAYDSFPETHFDTGINIPVDVRLVNIFLPTATRKSVETSSLKIENEASQAHRPWRHDRSDHGLVAFTAREKFDLPAIPDSCERGCSPDEASGVCEPNDYPAEADHTSNDLDDVAVFFSAETFGEEVHYQPNDHRQDRNLDKVEVCERVLPPPQFQIRPESRILSDDHPKHPEPGNPGRNCRRFRRHCQFAFLRRIGFKPMLSDSSPITLLFF